MRKRASWAVVLAGCACSSASGPPAPVAMDAAPQDAPDTARVDAATLDRAQPMDASRGDVAVVTDLTPDGTAARDIVSEVDAGAGADVPSESAVDVPPDRAAGLDSGAGADAGADGSIAPRWTSIAAGVSWNIVDGIAFGDSDAWAVGVGGALHFDGSRWSATDGIGADRPTGVWGTDDAHLWTVTVEGNVFRWSGTVWTPVTTGLRGSFQAISGSSDRDVWVVGDGGFVAHYDGATWTTVPSGVTTLLHAAVALRSDLAFIAGSGGTIVRWDGAALRTMDATTTAGINGLWATSATDVWATCGGGVILRYDGSAWRTVASPTSQGLYAAWGGVANDVWAVGFAGTVLRWDGGRWTLQSPPTAQPLLAVFGTRDSVWIGGNGGTLARWR